MENIIKGIRQYYPVSDSSLEVLFSHMEKLELPKKHLLIRGGVADRHVYFIEKGFCRSYCLHDGEEITIWFSREGDITFAMKDLYHDEPGYEYVELLEDCELYAIRIEDLNRTSRLPTGDGLFIRNACYIWICTISTGSIFRLRNVTNNSYVNNPMSFTVPNWGI